MLSGSRYKVATVRGIPIYVGSSWIWIAALYVYIRYLDLSSSGLTSTEAEAFALALLAATLFFGGVLIHEAAHAIVARAFDIQVSGITLVFWGGATEARSDAKGPLAEFLVAMVGPGSTLLLSFVLFAVAGAIDPPLIRTMIRDLAGLNLWFAAFNALPGFPLDGGRMLLAVVWGVSGSRHAAIRVAAYVGTAIGAVMIGGAIWAVNDGNIGLGIFLGYIGAMLTASGRGVSQRLTIRSQLAQGTVADAMRPPPKTVPAAISLSEALDGWLRENPRSAFPVVDGGKVIGTVSLDSARKVGSRDPLRPARDAIEPLTVTPVFAPTETLDGVVEWVSGRDGLVMLDGSLIGAIGAADIERWYRSSFGDDRGPAEPLTPPPRPDRPDL